MKIRKRWFWIGGAVLVALFMVAAMVRPKPGRTVQVADATKKNLVALVKAPGTIEAQRSVNISAEVPGKIVVLAVKEGDRVEKGQLLLRLDDAIYRAQVTQAEAQLASAKSRYRSAESAYKSAEPTYERRKALYERKLLSMGEMEDAEREYQTALSNFESAREEIGRLEAALTAAEDQLSKTVYRSPIAGTVIELNVEEGEIVVIGTMNNPGTRILAVGNLDRMIIKAEVDETDVVDVRIGQKATIEVDAMPDTSFEGVVTEIGHSALRTGGRATGETDFEVEVLFDDKVAAVLPGMTADVAIETATSDSALSVPIQSVVVRAPEDLEERKRGRDKGEKDDDEEPDTENAAAEEPSGDITGVFLVIDGKSEFREVRTGIASDRHIEIVGDVSSGDKIIIGPYNVLRDLRPGEKIKVDEPKRRRRGRS